MDDNSCTIEGQDISDERWNGINTTIGNKTIGKDNENVDKETSLIESLQTASLHNDNNNTINDNNSKEKTDIGEDHDVDKKVRIRPNPDKNDSIDDNNYSSIATVPFSNVPMKGTSKHDKTVQNSMKLDDITSDNHAMNKSILDIDILKKNDIINQFMESGGIIEADEDDSYLTTKEDNTNASIQSKDSVDFFDDDSTTTYSTNTILSKDVDEDSVSTTNTEKKELEVHQTMCKLNMSMSSYSTSSQSSTSSNSSKSSLTPKNNWNKVRNHMITNRGSSSNSDDLWKLLQESVARHTSKVTNQKLKAKRELKARLSSVKSLTFEDGIKVESMDSGVLKKRLSFQEQLLHETIGSSVGLLDSDRLERDSTSFSTSTSQPSNPVCSFCKYVFSFLTFHSNYYVGSYSREEGDRMDSLQSSLGFNIHSYSSQSKTDRNIA